MASITVDSSTMRDKANIFTTVASEIKALTEDMTNTIQSLQNSWEGTAGETLVATFSKLSSNFQEKYETIHSYASFLNEAADAYDQAEEAIMQGAQGSGN